MELIHKFPKVHKISWARRNVDNFPVTNVDPVCIFVVSKGLEDNSTGESSTPVNIFRVEDEIHHPIRQKGLLSIADEALGDISSFLQHRHIENGQLPKPNDSADDGETEQLHTPVESTDYDEIDQLPIPVESADEENGLTIIERLKSTYISTEDLDNEELNRIEAVQSPESSKSCAQECVRTSLCKIQVSTKTQVSNTENKYKPSVYIHTHFDMMYILGTCAYRIISQSSTAGTETRMCRVRSTMQMAVFVTIVTLSTFQSFCDAKYFLLWFLAGGGLNQLVRFAFNLNNLGICVYGAYLLCRKGNDINKMVETMNVYEKNWEGNRAQPVYSFVIVIVSIFLALIKALLLVDFDELSAERVLLQSSHELSEDLFLWSSASLNSTTLQLESKFGTSLNPVTALMGIVKIFRNFAFALLHSMIWDIIGNVVLIMMCWMVFFMKFVHTVEENVSEENELMETVPEETQEEAINLQVQRIVVWKMYRQIRVAFAAVNEVFGPLLMLFHVTNVLRYAFFMERVIYPEEATTFEYIHILYDIVKSEIVYLTATSIAKQNKVIRKWLRNWARWTGKIDLGNREMDITVVLDELDEEPLGLGQGDLLIHQGFHFGLLGLVSSLFVMLANKTGAKF